MAGKTKKARGPSKKKADDTTVEARVTDVLRLKLDGAARHDVLQYVAEKEALPESPGEPNPWRLGPREKPMSVRQVDEYMARATAEIKRIAGEARADALDQHLAMRRARYAASCVAGDNATALRCLDSEARLLDLFPADKHEHAGPGGGPIQQVVIKHAGAPVLQPGD